MRIVLAAAAGFEIIISLIGLISERALGFLIYFQPHIAVIFAEESFLGTRQLGWSSLVIGTLLIAAVPVIGRSKKAAIVYLIGQSLYAVVAGLLFVLIAALDMSGAHGPSRQEVIIPALVLLAFVVFPVAIVMRHIGQPSEAVAAKEVA